MRAQVCLQLSYPVLLLPKEDLPTLNLSVRSRERTLDATVSPPYRSKAGRRFDAAVVEIPLADQADSFDPDPTPPVEGAVEVEGVNPIRADAIAIEVAGLREVDRRPGPEMDAFVADIVQAAREAADVVLCRLRSILRAPALKGFAERICSPGRLCLPRHLP